MMAYLRTQANLAEMDREALMDGVKRFKQMMDPLFYGLRRMWSAWDGAWRCRRSSPFYGWEE